ncbi:riboflavin synthase [Taibaiella chishuiensis]|uniref:Riboflavin synthase n=1 Tax=Taibaiella chishuiensis TaxID=1434707 RepID=A0A2P8D458_9BACT|nr:riboflavin synthase [Taibaiella chishuiensis]PSK91982.1 riboflavin synthase alpha chain [Taibaiella chishuiensis]
MFTGIVESLGTIAVIRKEGSNVHFTVNSPISNELKIDQSVAHDGVCLTVVALDDHSHTVTAVAETLQKTNLADWQQGRTLNLERAMKLGDRLDGHIVQGHVDDGNAVCTGREEVDGSHLFTFEFPERFAALVIEKGSICINGTSLTAFNVGRNTFAVTIIPYTIEHTNFKHLQAGDRVNLEFDILGKYFLRMKEVGA